VSDQFVFRAGGSVPITNTITATLAWRVEGVPRYGDSTFPEYVSIVTYSVRLGGKSSSHTVPARPASDQPATPRTPEVIRPGEGA
jgi:hypothetical protein